MIFTLREKQNNHQKQNNISKYYCKEIVLINLIPTISLSQYVYTIVIPVTGQSTI